jgi:hypothetical protein
MYKNVPNGEVRILMSKREGKFIPVLNLSPRPEDVLGWRYSSMHP